MVKAVAIDINEFARFFITGVTATIGNIAAVWLARGFVSFDIALLAGVVTGLAISFALSKFYAFGSRSWERARGEVARFLVVYAVGSSMYWAVAVIVGRLARDRGVAAEVAEIGGTVVGAATMTVTSYFGHRFFTYRTYQRPGVRDAS